MGTGLAGLKFAKAVSFLLIKHLAILDLCLNISSNFSLTLLTRLHLVRLVLAEHLLEVLFLLTTLLLLEITLDFHLVFKAIHKIDFSLEGLSVLPFPALLLIFQLTVTAFFLLHDFLTMSSSFLLLTLTQQCDMLGLESLVGAALLKFSSLTLLLLHELLVELAANKLAALLLTHHRLLLLLVMQQCVELLNGGPLVLLREFRKDFGLGGNARSDRLLICRAP